MHIGMTFLNYLVSPIVFLISLYMFLKNPKSYNVRAIFIMGIFITFAGSFIGAAFDLGNAQSFELSAWSVRLAAVTIWGAYLSAFRLSLTFPKERKLTPINILLALVWIAITVVILTGHHYLVGTTIKNGIFHRIEGSGYLVIQGSGVLILLIATIIFLVKVMLTKEKILRLQILLIALGSSVAIFFGVIITIFIPKYLGIYKYYPLSSLAGLVLAFSFAYAMTRTKLFNITSGIYKTSIFLLSLIIIGFLDGALLTSLKFLHLSQYPILEFLIFTIILLLLTAISRLLSSKIGNLLKLKSDYKGNLQNALDTLSFNKTPKNLIAELATIFKQTIGSEKVNIFIQNSLGSLEKYYGSSKIETIDKGNQAIEIISSRSDKQIIFSSEIISDPFFIKHAEELKVFFNTLSSQALILIRDGDHVLMLLALGEKENKRPYDSYDYSVFESLLSRLFTLSYYLQNFQKQAVAQTIEKQLQISQNIISSLSKNITLPPEKFADMKHLTKTESGLGGDFVDSIKINPNRYLVILGDLSGQGLTASMSMAILKSTIRVFLRNSRNFKQIVINLNKHIKEHFPRGVFFAGIFLLFDFSKSECYFINCGVPLLYLYSSQFNSVSELQGEGKVLGFVKNIEPLISIKKFDFKSGDVLFTATDGFTDARAISGEKYPIKNIAKIISEESQSSASEILNQSYGDWYQFLSGKIEDDASLVVIKL